MISAYPSETVDTFENILHTYQDRVYNQAYRMLGNQEDAEEATQDIFMNVYRALDDFRGDSKLSTWIYRIASNVCISRLRKKQLSVKSLDDPIDDDGAVFGDMIPNEDIGDPADMLTSKETAESIRGMVRELPAEWAMAISLYHFDDLSYEEIADTMDIPKATVATYIHRGRKKLAEMIIKRFPGDR